MPKSVFGRGWVLAFSVSFALLSATGCAKYDDSAAPETRQAFSTTSASAKNSQMGGYEADSISAHRDGAPDMAKVGGGPSAGSGPLNGFVAVAASNNFTLPPVQTRQVIRKADLDVRVENVEKAEKTANAAIEASGGYTDSASSTDLASAHPELTMTARIPVARFDSMIGKFESLGVRLAKSINSEDVTGHIVDMDAQLKTLRVQAEVYRNMLKNRTQLSDVFEVQQQLTNVQTQIEDIDARRKSESGLAAMSTITLKLEQDGVVSQPSTDPGWMTQSWAGATSGASGALRSVTVIGMWLLCFSPFWIPVALLLRKLAIRARKPDPIASSLAESLQASRQ